MLLYRIEKAKYLQVFPSRGSLFSEGRWNRKGMWVVYTSETVALAKLEALANSGSRLPSNRYLITIEIDDKAPVVEITQEELPDDWYSIPYRKKLSHYIQQILDSRMYVAAIVPSIQSTKEKNILLFPDYPKFDKYVKLVGNEPELFD
jgi:RES domain-containing protein